MEIAWIMGLKFRKITAEEIERTLELAERTFTSNVKVQDEEIIQNKEINLDKYIATNTLIITHCVVHSKYEPETSEPISKRYRILKNLNGQYKIQEKSYLFFWADIKEIDPVTKERKPLLYFTTNEARHRINIYEKSRNSLKSQKKREKTWERV